MRNKTRNTFLKNYGVYYAALGGTFGTYRTADEAFEQAKKFKPYRSLNIGKGEQDFPNFKKGFDGFQKLRIACQLEKKRAEAQNANILRSIDFLSE